MDSLVQATIKYINCLLFIPDVVCINTYIHTNEHSELNVHVYYSASTQALTVFLSTFCIGC